MYSKLKDYDKVKYNNETYIFININGITFGHYERGIRWKIITNYYKNEELKNYCMNKINELFKYASYSNQQYYKDKFMILYKEIINNDIFNFLKEDIKSYYFYKFIYLNELNKENQEKKLKELNKDKYKKRLSL